MQKLQHHLTRSAHHASQQDMVEEWMRAGAAAVAFEPTVLRTSTSVSGVQCAMSSQSTPRRILSDAVASVFEMLGATID